MNHILLLCRSLTYAQRTVRLLEQGGISAYLQRAPQGVTRRGCAYCVRIREINFSRALELLTAVNLRPDGAYAWGEDGTLREVSLP